MATVTDLANSIVVLCNKQLTEGFNLAASFVWQTNLVLIFQKV
jgi:hypothetical protein